MLKERDRLVVIFDANLPPETICWHGCSGGKHLCKEGFPDGVRVLDHQGILVGWKDYLVVRYAMRRLRGLDTIGADTRIFIFTRDRGFWGSARHQWESRRRKAVDVQWPNYRVIDVWVQTDQTKVRKTRELAIVGGRLLRIEVAYIESPRKVKKVLLEESIRTMETILEGSR